MLKTGGDNKIPGDIEMMNKLSLGVPQSKQELGLFWCHLMSGNAFISLSALTSMSHPPVGSHVFLYKYSLIGLGEGRTVAVDIWKD